MKSYEEIAREVLRRRDNRVAIAAQRRAAAVKTGSVIACFCAVALSGFFAVNNNYITKPVVDTSDDRTQTTVSTESADDPISAYFPDDTTESDDTSINSEPLTETDAPTDTTSEPNDTTRAPETSTPVTETEPPREPETVAPPETKPEPPETSAPPADTTAPEPPEPPVSDDTTDPIAPPVNDPPEDATDPVAPPANDPPEDTTGSELPPINDPPEDTDPPVVPILPEDPYPPYGDPVWPGLDWSGGGFTDIGDSSFGSAHSTTVTKADLFYLLYYCHSGDFVEEEKIFADVPLNRWYSQPVTWAAKSGILYSVPGNDGEYLFAFDEVTHQDLACYLYALAGSPQVNGSIDGYSDFDKVSPYAVTALTWCVENGIITDTKGRLAPLSTFSLYRFETVFAVFKTVVG